MTPRDQVVSKALSLMSELATLLQVLQTDGGDKFTTKQAAHRLGVDDSYVRQMVRSGELRAIRHGRAIRIPIEAVEELERKRTAPRIRAVS